MIDLYKPGPPIKKDQLEAVEKTLGLTLPNDYKEQILHHNGGVFEAGSFFCRNGFPACIDWLYHVLPGDDNDIINCNEARAGRLPKGFVAIGPDPFGNEICINCLPGADYGKVYFWDHDREAEPEDGETPETVDNYHLIADSFTEFLNGLYKEPEPTEEEMANVRDTSSPIAKARMKKMMELDGLI